MSVCIQYTFIPCIMCLNCYKVICACHSADYGFIFKMMTGAQNKDGGPLIPHHKLGLNQFVCVRVLVCVHLRKSS